VPLAALIDQAINRVRSEVEAAELRIDNRVRGTGYRIHAVVEVVIQCFAQLIQNAAKFAGKRATLAIDASSGESEFRVVFADDGPGIPSDQLESAFGMFQQIDEENTGEVPGVGLGLWWSREVIQAHGGDVRIESPPSGEDRGTAVLVVLPHSMVSEGGADDTEPGADQPEAQDSSARSETAVKLPS
jgi:K+-sensing histidine kinase KdpD